MQLQQLNLIFKNYPNPGEITMSAVKARYKFGLTQSNVDKCWLILNWPSPKLSNQALVMLSKFSIKLNR